MRKPATGEPYAGKPPVRFGGRGGQKPSLPLSIYLLLRQRMQVTHQTFKTLLDHMGVDLRGRDVGVAEQRLHDAQIGAVVQEMAGEGMAQHMRRDQPWR